MTGVVRRNDLGRKNYVNRPTLGRALEDEIGVDTESVTPPEDNEIIEPPSQPEKAELVRPPLPPAMEQKLRDEHAGGASEAALMRRWGLLHEEVTRALGS